MKGTKRGQVSVEAAVLLTFIVAAFVFMGVYLQRGAQGGMKGNADSMGTQFQSTTQWSTTSASKTHSTATKTITGQCANATSEYGTPETDSSGVFSINTSGLGYDDAGDCTPTEPAAFDTTVILP